MIDINRICPNCMNEIPQEDDFCTNCGFKKGDTVPASSHALKPYTILQGKYLVGKSIGEGGFGITYIGFDLNLEIKIAIKEFYPGGYVSRESETTSNVTVYTNIDKTQYDKWKESFVREARSLARFSDLPGIVHVRDFFQENNTAYIVMEYVKGITLKEYLKEHGGRIGVQETFSMMLPVIQSLAKVHEAQIIHRDISPDNIMIQENGLIKLIDFGAARDFGGTDEKSLSVLLKPGFAPEEQYRSKGNQGPWTDVYALCATIYRCITGEKPPESMERMRQDTIKRPSSYGIQIESVAEEAIMAGLAVFAENRIKTMGELEAKLYNGQTETVALNNVSSNINNSIGDASGNKKKSGSSENKKYIVIALGIVGALVIAIVGFVLGKQNGSGGVMDNKIEDVAERNTDVIAQDVDIQSDADNTTDEDNSDNTADVTEDVAETENSAEVEETAEAEEPVPEESEAATEETAEEADTEIQTEETDYEEALYEEFKIDRNTVEDYSANLDPKKYLRYDSGMGEFYFWYPANLFNAVYVDEYSYNSTYGENIKTIAFSGSNGGELSFAMYRRTDGRSVEEFSDIVHSNEANMFYESQDILYKTDADKGKIVVTGNADAAGTSIVYDLIKVDADYVYRMLSVKRSWVDDFDKLTYSYVVENEYRTCGFSGSTKATQTWEEFLEANQ
ncbi:protein kinase domain-containing protein [Butyrivibrio sp. MB2005]|uniref:protein kinase domain-containing protein n=1 Tax=Butyrivibrio sp. MB2005 TaxID=1280678 RepID=UPI00068453F1|nr:protein kinase [Butyrivibrio sp. MB2005]